MNYYNFIIILNICTLASSSSNWEYDYNIGKLSYKVEVLTKEQLTFGLAPHWDAENQILYFVDVDEQSVHSYNPKTNEHYSAIVKGNKTIQIIIPVEGKKDTFIVTQKNDLAVITWNGKDSTPIEPEVIDTFEPNDNDNRLHDGKVDSKGRLWTGSMQEVTLQSTFPPQASLYSWSHVDHKVKKHLDGVKISNGMAWSLDNKFMYYADSFTFKVDRFDFDVDTGSISNRKTLFDFADYNITGAADGLTIDTNGDLLVVNYYGGKLLHIKKTGELLSEFELPSKVPAAVVFGGEQLNEIYVITVNLDLETSMAKPRNETSCDGRLLRIKNLGLKGFPSRKMKL